MAAISSDIEVDDQIKPRNTRFNEIVAIALTAVALLLFLCLLSYDPNDPSWNAAGQSGAHNWIGAIGANVAAALFQGIGLGAYLLPFLFLAAAWRRFRSLRIKAPISRIIGLVALVFSSSALLSLANLKPFYDASFNAGGLAGAVIAGALVSGLNTIGAAILLLAIAVTAVLLATNFSFTDFYEGLSLRLADRFGAIRSLPERFRARREARRIKKLERLERKRLARIEAAAEAGLDPTSEGEAVTGKISTVAEIRSGTEEI